MREPKHLNKGDAIALVAPSFGCTTEPFKTRLKASIECFEKLGYRIIEGANIWKDVGPVASASAKARAKEFMDAYKSEASLILSVGGGELMNEILPYIDFIEIKQSEPKWFMGFSDNTNLAFTITTLCDVMTIYGPCAPSFFSLPFSLNTRDAMRMVQGGRVFKGYKRYEDHPKRGPNQPILRPLNLTEKKVIRAFNYNEPIEGTILSGCLDCLVNLCGTKYDNVAAFANRHKGGIIWCLEACDLNPLSIRRALFELKEAGWFVNAKAFLFGRHLCREENAFGCNKWNAVLGALGDLNVPIITDIDLGHIPPSMPIKNGAKAVVSLEKGNIVFRYHK